MSNKCYNHLHVNLGKIIVVLDALVEKGSIMIASLFDYSVGLVCLVKLRNVAKWKLGFVVMK